MHGALHQLLSTFVFVGLLAACFVFARRFAVWGERGWAIYSVTSGVVFAVAFVLTSLGFAQTSGFADIAGLLQRGTITVGWTWLSPARRSPIAPPHGVGRRVQTFAPLHA